MLIRPKEFTAVDPRRFTTWSTCLGLALLLTGCGGESGDPGPPEEGSEISEDVQGPALPEPEFVDLDELYEPWIDDGLVAQTREWAEKADVEELLPYLDDIAVFKLPEHVVEEGVGSAWYASASEFFWFDGAQDVRALDSSSPCLPPGAAADFVTGGVAHIVLPPDAGPLMFLHELAHHHKHSTDQYNEITELFGAASYDDECNVIATTGQFDEFLPEEWPVTETFEYSFNDFAATNFYGGDYDLPPEVIVYFQQVFQSD